ncbi:unnamed protein product [Paramecium sonneborni]|uniref:Uncharacterized protein n=1 Tax=Paramecium sonneborni TaxID=65129 RepID=A0A8S1RPP8_9CILI|nr:unnamed protein product [Paramecium sonneborni]
MTQLRIMMINNIVVWLDCQSSKILNDEYCLSRNMSNNEKPYQVQYVKGIIIMIFVRVQRYQNQKAFDKTKQAIIQSLFIQKFLFLIKLPM